MNTESVAGYTAFSNTVLNILDAYDDDEITALHPDLNFDKTWDAKTGYRTTQILAVPIQFDRQTLGVLQLINRKDDSPFTQNDEMSAQEIAKILGIAIQNQQRLTKKRPTKFDYLIRQNVLAEPELEKAIIKAREEKTDVEQLLMKEFGVSREDVGAALSEFFKCRFVQFDDKMAIPGDILHNLKKAYLRSNLWVPLQEVDGQISVLMDDPNHLTKRDMVQTLLKSTRIEYCVGSDGRHPEVHRVLFRRSCRRRHHG